MPITLINTTVGRDEDAQRIAQAVLARRLAACVQLYPVQSWYEWEGEMRSDTEIKMVFKTSPERCDALQQALKEMHPYQLPEIYSVLVQNVDEPYAAWVQAGTVIPAGQ